MSEEIDKKLYSHYKHLSEGHYKSGNPVRDQLVVDDAKKHLADLIKKRPTIKFEEAPLEEKPEEEIKSKRKK